MCPTLRDELTPIPKELRKKDEAMAEVYNEPRMGSELSSRTGP